MKIIGAIFHFIWWVIVHFGKWSILIAVIFGLNLFFPPIHWASLLDNELMTNEEIAESAKDLTVKWSVDAEKPVTREKAGQLKAGTKVKVLGVLEPYADGRLMHSYYEKIVFLVQLPDSSRLLACLPEAAELARAVVLKTGDTVNVLSVSKKKKNYTYKVSNGKVYKLEELNFIPFQLPIYYENKTKPYISEYPSVNKVLDLVYEYSLLNVPTGIYKIKFSGEYLNGKYGAIIMRGLSGVLDAFMMILFVMIIKFIISHLMTIIPWFPNRFQKVFGGLLIMYLFALYLLFVSGISANILVFIGGLIIAIKGNNSEIYYNRCCLCRHGYKLEFLGNELVDTQKSSGWENYSYTESRNNGETVYYEVDSTGYRRETGRRPITEYRTVYGRVYVTRITEFWEDHFLCHHCNQESVYSYTERRKEEGAREITDYGSWH